VPRVGQHEHDSVDVPVTLLEGDAALQGLEVRGPQLGLDADPQAPRLRHRIPGPLVTRLRQGHLGPPGCSLGKWRPEATKQATVAFIPERRSAGVGAHTQIEPHDRQEHPEQPEGDVSCHAPFDLADPRGRHAGEPRHVDLPQPGDPPCLTQLVAQLSQAGPSPTCAAVSLTLLDDHG